MMHGSRFRRLPSVRAYLSENKSRLGFGLDCVFNRGFDSSKRTTGSWLGGSIPRSMVGGILGRKAQGFDPPRPVSVALE